MLIKMINENDILTLTRAHTLAEHMARTHQIIIFIQIQNNQKLLLPIHTVKTHIICNTHTTHSHVRIKCISNALAFPHTYMSIFKITALTASFQWQLINCAGYLDFGWMPFFPFGEPGWPHKFVKRTEKRISFLSQLFIFAALSEL